ncbi:MAG: hypothetical protein ACXV5Q_04075 [Frankiaceae bacterium]
MPSWLDRSPETFKSWERRGRIRRAGVDRQGRVTYDVRELARQAGRADARRGKATREWGRVERE